MNTGRLLKFLGIAGFLLAVSAFFLPLVNPDLFWHLSAGRWIAGHLAVPRADFLSWPLGGQEWIDFEWLSQLIYYSLFRAGGFGALFFFKVSLLALTLAVVWRLLRLYGRSALAFLLLPAFSAGILGSCDLRPENFTLLFFACLLYQLEKARLAGGPRWSAGTALASLSFFALWTNLHAGYLYGLALLFFYFAGGLLREELPFIYGRAPLARPEAGLACLKLFGTGLAASLVNPYGWNIYKVILNHGRYLEVLQEQLIEWRPVDLANIYQRPYLLALAFVFAAVLYALLKNKKAVYEHIAALIFFAWASSNHARHIPFFILTGLAYSLEALRGTEMPGLSKRAARLAQGLAGLLLLWWYSSVVWPQYRPSFTFFRAYSDGLADFLKAESGRLAGLRLYNRWDWGGFLGWKLYPEYRVFMDGRYLFHGALEEDAKASGSMENWEKFIGERGFGLMLIEPNDPKAPMTVKLSGGRKAVVWRPAYLFYLPEKDWAVVYWDSRSLALVRRAAVPPGWLKQKEYRYLRPGDLSNLVAPVTEGRLPLKALGEEVERYIKNTPASYPTSLNARVDNFWKNLRELCRDKKSNCREQ